ncbi:TonB-dependent receptor [Croceivirga radicis]|uniref:TonB-dependent receptor n=1 Tax=Croceivirga radicis TaxID=1929488 RepID=UPI000255AD36|nr:carboxypeptidase-like regulatory domain-containing protein [Croceivirga radicis]
MLKKTIFLFVFCLIGFSIYAQDNPAKDTIKINAQTLKEALKQLNSIADYSFYYDANSLDSIRLTKTYTSTTIQELLEAVLQNTNLNYYVFEGNKIILTENNIIYDKLPEGFFKKDSVVKPIEPVSRPIFYSRNNKQTRLRSRIETVRLGKEQKNNSRTSFRVYGRVTNNNTGEPIPDMTIIAQNGTLKALTSLDGNFEMELNPGENVLNFRALGIKQATKRLIIFNDGELNFGFDESLEQLDEVVVQGNIYRNVEETAGAPEEIDSEESKTVPLVLGERDVLKVATALPGISTAGEGSTGFNVRGGRADQNLMLFDGATIYNPQHFFGIFSAINPFSIGKLSVYKGNIPAAYGGRLSSVFDINTKIGDTTAFKGEASLGPVTGNLVLQSPVKKGKSSILFGARGAYANWILRSLNEKSLNKSRASFYDGVLNYNDRVNENNTVKVTTYYSDDNFSISSDSTYIYRNKLASLQWQHKFNDKNLANVQLSYTGYGFNIDYGRGSNDDFKLGFDIEEYRAKFDFNYLKSTKTSFNYGIESRLYSVVPGYIEPLNNNSIVESNELEREKGLETAAYLSVEQDISKAFSINMGVRYSTYAGLGSSTQYTYDPNAPRSESTRQDTINYQNNEFIDFQGNPEFRIGARYLLNPSLSIKAGFNTATQYIHILTNNTTISPIDTWKLTDTNIKPQKGQQFSLGVFKNIESNTYEVSLEGFYKTARNVIDFKTGAQLLLNENIETEILQGDGKSYGVEFLIRKNLGKLNGWLGYTYSRSFLKLDSEFEEERVNNGEFFASNFDKPHDVSLVANYKFTKRYSLSANFVYQTGRPVTVPVGNFNFNDAQYAAYSDRNSLRIPDFYRLDLGFNIEGNHKLNKVGHSFWTISVYNALGRNNPYSVFYVTESGRIKAYKSSIFSIPVPSITYNFKF